MDEIEKKIALLERRFSRERNARKEAEQLLEQKSLELYETNQLLHVENRRIRYLIHSLPVAMMLYNQQHVISANPAFHELFGVWPEGRAIASYGEELGLSLQAHPERRVQHEIHQQDRTITTLLQFVPLIDEQADMLEYETLMVAIDISDRIKMDEAQQYAAFQAGIAEMSASILHNIGNIVTGMHGSLMQLGRLPAQIERLEKGLQKAGASKVDEVGLVGDCAPLQAQVERDRQVFDASIKILSGLRGEEKMGQYLDKLELGVHHIGEIIQLQQKAARPETHITRFHYPSMIADTLSLIQDRIDKFGIEIEVNIDADIQLVELPRNPMIQMVMNFIKNSMEAIGQRVRSEFNYKGRIDIVASKSGEGRFIFTITDNGCGIEAARLESIFNFGETDKRHGSGYGLHSAANFVRSLQGRIEASSDGVNLGATMTVELPLVVESRHHE